MKEQEQKWLTWASRLLMDYATGTSVQYREGMKVLWEAMNVLYHNRKEPDMNPPVHLQDVTCIRETEKALLVEYEGEEFWVPQSVIHADSEVYQKDTEGTLVVARWWAESRSLVEKE